METVVRNVQDLTQNDRCVLERVIGHPLLEGERLVIQVTSMTTEAANQETASGGKLPVGSDIVAGLSDQEIDDLDAAIARSNSSRGISEAIASLQEIARLPENWDSYGAERIRQSSILATIKLLYCVMRGDIPVPALVPTNRRTVLVEWHTRGIDLEVEVLATDRFHVAFADARDGSEWEADIGSDQSQLVQSIERLSQRD